MLPDNAFSGNKDYIHVVIETPKGSRNKYAYDEKTGMFQLTKVLPLGLMFPLDFGFIPHTKGGDGDPLDILVVADDVTFTGCLIECRCLGVIEAEQTERDGKKERNDRLIAVPVKDDTQAEIKSLEDLGKKQLNDIVVFFQHYNKMAGKEFKVLKIEGPEKAIELIKKSKA